MGSNTSKQAKHMNVHNIERRRLYNEKLVNALENKLRLIQEFRPDYCGNWNDYITMVDILFIEDLYYKPEFGSFK